MSYRSDIDIVVVPLIQADAVFWGEIAANNLSWEIGPIGGVYGVVSLTFEAMHSIYRVLDRSWVFWGEAELKII